MTYEKSDTTLVQATSGNTTNPGTMEKLFTPIQTNYQGQIGNTKLWLAGGDYPDGTNFWSTWLGVLVWDFPFLKPYDANGNGVIDVAEQHNNDIGVFFGYFAHAFGIIGVSALIFAMFEFFQGILPW